MKKTRTKSIYTSLLPSTSIGNKKEQNPDILHISPSHHYPAGIVTQIIRRYELLAWANENPNRFLIEDDYDGEFRFTYDSGSKKRKPKKIYDECKTKTPAHCGTAKFL
ncbi:MAG: hypothetical protein SPE59_08035 [Treponema sp.]|nr:hypothetical protein [Treponema sp.]